MSHHPDAAHRSGRTSVSLWVLCLAWVLSTAASGQAYLASSSPTFNASETDKHLYQRPDTAEMLTGVATFPGGCYAGAPCDQIFVSGFEPYESTDTSWQVAWDTHDQATIDAWYQANTGYDGLGLDSSTFLDIGTAIIDNTWLQAHEDNGHVSFADGRWLVERIRATRVRIAESNVTVRGCLIDAGGAHIYGAQHYPTFSNSISGTVVAYCTIVGSGSEGTGLLFRSNVDGFDTVIARNNDIHGWGTGMDLNGNVTVAYNHVHDIYYYPGSHNTSAVNRGANVWIYRNNLDDGNSAALSVYADNIIHNMVVEQNLFNTPRANYCINFPSSKPYFDETYDAHLTNNVFGQKYEPTCGSSAPMTAGNWTTQSGNTMMDGSPL